MKPSADAAAKRSSSGRARRTSGRPDDMSEDGGSSRPNHPARKSSSSQHGSSMYAALGGTREKEYTDGPPGTLATSRRSPSNKYAAANREQDQEYTDGPPDTTDSSQGSEYATAGSRSARTPLAQNQKYAVARRMELENDKMAAMSPSYQAQKPPAQSLRYAAATRKGLSHEERSALEDELQVGAVRIPGRPASSSGASGSVVESEYYDSVRPPNVQAGISTAERTHLADAVLIDEEAEERRIAERLERERQDVPIAYAEKEIPWYKRKSFIAAVIVLAIAVIVTVVVVVLTTRNNDAAPDFPTFSPTFSPAPTAVTVITLALQLDSKPHETGWALECDEETLESVAPGTYALVGLRPNFRVVYETIATIGAECRFTVTDSGNDGLNGGFFEIFYGDDIGQRSARITGGTILASKTTVVFNVENVPTGEDPSVPANPTSSPPINCSVCPDGSAPGFPDATTDEFGGKTCEEVDRTISELSLNSEECRLIRDSTGSECGCNDFCTTVCPDGVSEPDPANDDNVVLVETSGRQVKCADLQEGIVSSKNNSVDECLSANFLGEDVCGCPPIDARCRICQGGVVPPAEDLATEIVPGVTCRDITGIAYTLRKNDPSGIFFQLCPACLAIGVYCGCEQPPIEDGGREFCRLCGQNNEDLLPEPGRLVNSTVLNQATTCFHLELESNVKPHPNNTANSTIDGALPCDEYQKDGAETCCS